MAEKKSRGWLTVVYPESAVSGWQSLLAERGGQALISPLHDKDVNADGEVKKAHYHVLLIWQGPASKSVAEGVVSLIGGVGCLPCISMRGTARYLCHMDNPDKYQYDRADVQQIGGIDYDDIVNSSSDDLSTLYDIFDWIDETSCVSFRDFIFYARHERPDWARVVLTRHRENVIVYQRSLKWTLDNFK